MEKKIGEVFEYNGVTLITIENNSCEGCFFNNRNICTIGNRLFLCSSIFREDNKNVIFRDDNKNVTFKEVKDMESRTIQLTLEKAKEFYKKGGELRDLALSVYTKDELTRIELPRTWEKFCSKVSKKEVESYIGTDSDILSAPYLYRDPKRDRNVLPSKDDAKAHLVLMQLHQLRDCYRQGWEPNWLDDENKYCIVYSAYNYVISINAFTSTFLSFQSREIAQLFLDNFRNLIEEAGDLI